MTHPPPPPPGSGPTASPGQPGQKKSGNTVVWVVLGIIGGLAALCCLGSSIAFYQLSHSPDGKKIFSAIGKGAQIAQKGLTAPGTSELRQAGCPQAMVVDLKDAMDTVRLFVDAGSDETNLTDEVMVLCQGNAFESLPGDCEALADTYRAAAHPTAPFTIIVQQQGASKPRCQKRFAADGSSLKNPAH